MALKPVPPPQAKTLNCPGCGGSLTIRAPRLSLSVACASCGSVLDPSNPDAGVIARHRSKTTVTPPIPLGSRGKLKGELFEVIGYLVRRIKVEDTYYSWGEYCLFNPYHGLRWLTEYGGHWIFAKTASGVPKEEGDTISYLGDVYRRFQSARAELRHVIGELPWRAKVGDTATVTDWIHPPLIVSREANQYETTWSIGEYVEGDQVWKAFGLAGSPPAKVGVGAAQPSPFEGEAPRVKRLALYLMAALLLVQVGLAILSQNRVVYERSFVMAQPPAQNVVVTEPFELTGRRSNVVIDLTTTLSNSWMFVNMALVDQATEQALRFGREVSYYFGADSDGSWSEGSSSDRVYLPSVPAGTYFLVIDPEGQTYPTQYTVRVRRDVPRMLYSLVAFGVLAVPPVIFWYRKRRFEYQRWKESDHPMSPLVNLGQGSDDDDD